MMLSSKFHDFFLEARENQATRPFLIMNVYKDCMVVTRALDDDGETSSSWSRALADNLKNQLQLPDSKDFGQLNKCPKTSSGSGH